ncbi:MAG: hypothetical protein CMM25_08175 [Rhodospirillaceae bacterium]|nr:hypothetical protein [Rhodospirillaceae bacterium]
MATILQSLPRTVMSGFLLTIIIYVLGTYAGLSTDLDIIFWQFAFRWLHVLSGVMWIGLLWYFNFVQIPNMGNIPDEQKPAIGKVIAPAALFWFRWGAMATLISGLILAMISGYLIDSITVSEGYRWIGIGMWLGAIMFFNVWFVIWPNQKKALGIVEVDAETKASSARTAMLFSRTNTLLSIPMLFCMVAQQNFGF